MLTTSHSSDWEDATQSRLDPLALRIERNSNGLMTVIPVLDAVLNAHAELLGDDLDGYRNHTYRVANFCLALSPDEPDVCDKVAIAAAFHDIGIWTDGTFDYLEPSVRSVAAFLTRIGRKGWEGEIVEMIRQHHKLTPWRGKASRLVEPFRKADWVDVSKGLLSFELTRRFRSSVMIAWPNAGFHRKLVRLTLERAARHPLSPLPMLKR
jgi:hypothetical protein